MIQVFTLAAAARAAEVRVLADSIASALPAARFLWAVCGPFDEATLALGAAEIAPLASVCPPGRQRASWTGSQAADADPGLAAPDVALSLMRRPGCEGVLFLAPEVVMFSAVPELFPGDAEADVVLVPSILRPGALAATDLPTSELRALRQGVFSTSLVAIAPTPNAERILSWWSDRAHAIVPPPGTHNELRPWLNLAPALFRGVRVLRSSRYAVGRDNLCERRLQGTPDDGVRVDGKPLACFDFTGVADGSLETAATDGRGDRRTLEALVGWYRDRLRGATGRAANSVRGSIRRKS